MFALVGAAGFLIILYWTLATILTGDGNAGDGNARQDAETQLTEEERRQSRQQGHRWIALAITATIVSATTNWALGTPEGTEALRGTVLIGCSIFSIWCAVQVFTGPTRPQAGQNGRNQQNQAGGEGPRPNQAVPME